LRLLVIAMLATCLLAVSGERVRADYTVVEVNFIMADKNGDLLISKPEYLLVALDTFKNLAQNGNNELDPDEVGDLAKDPEFLDGDADKNGSLSVEEVITEKLADFEAADTNKDGALNVDEVTAYDKK
jgi:EF hand